MDLRDQVAALNALGRLRLSFSPIRREWWARCDRIDLAGGGLLTGIMGRGPTTEAAVVNLWHEVTHLPCHLHLIRREEPVL